MEIGKLNPDLSERLRISMSIQSIDYQGIQPHQQLLEKLLERVNVLSIQTPMKQI